MATYDKTELRLNASDLAKIAVKIEAAIEDRRPRKGSSWRELDERLEHATNTLWAILKDMGDSQ